MQFHIIPSAPTPIYRQIVDQVRRLVAGGQLRRGDELPSVRAAAQAHAINPMTVSKAYSLLEAEGLLERRRGLAMVVAGARPPARMGQRLSLLRPSLEAAARAAQDLEIAPDKAVALFRECLDEALTGEPGGEH
jgi:GntR family transcriptional regulator